jgi:hypothetical protein
MSRVLGASLLAIALGTAAGLPAQELRATLPRGASRGQEVEVRCYGRGLSDLASVLWFGPGIETLAIEAERDDRVKLRLRVAEDCAFGAHLFLLHTRRGLTRPKTFHVGPLPSLASADDNTRREAAQPIPLEVTVDGRILAEETDWFAFEAEAGQLVRVEVEGVRLADADFDLQVEVFGPDGELLVRGDDSPLGRLDPMLALPIVASGTHRIALRDVAFRGATFASYRLHLGTFPRPVGMLPCGGRPGETLSARLVGDAEPAEVTLTLPERPGLHEVFPEVLGRPVPTPVRVAVDERPSFVEGAGPAEPPSAPCAFHGIVGEDGEEDRHAFRATKGERIDMRALARILRSPLDPVLVVRDAKGAVLASNDDGLGLDGRLRFTAPADGVFSACVADHLGRGGPAFFYRVEVGALDAGATTQEAVPGRRAEDLGVAVPAGARNATLIQVSGLDARDGIDLGFDGLPDGVRAAPVRLPAGQTMVPLVFEATPEAAVGAALATPTARAEVEPQLRPVAHEHPAPLLRIRNDAVYEQRAIRALPVAVTEACPFDVAATVPGVPLVQSGALQLPVTITRAEGFDGTVAVRMLATPAGISAGTVTLRAGQHEGSMALSARSNAAVGRWPVVLVATATVGGVARTVSTGILTLEVEEPWITARLSRARIEQGASAPFTITLERRRAFDGLVRAELGRLPKGVSAEMPAIAADLAVVEAALKATADAAVGRHRSVYLRLTVETAGGVVEHSVGGGEIRVDRPLDRSLDGGER